MFVHLVAKLCEETQKDIWQRAYPAMQTLLQVVKEWPGDTKKAVDRIIQVFLHRLGQKTGLRWNIKLKEDAKALATTTAPANAPTQYVQMADRAINDLVALIASSQLSAYDQRGIGHTIISHLLKAGNVRARDLDNSSPSGIEKDVRNQFESILRRVRNEGNIQSFGIMVQLKYLQNIDVKAFVDYVRKRYNTKYAMKRDKYLVFTF